MVIMGYLKKLGSENSYMHKYTFQKRFFVLDLQNCVFKYAKSHDSTKFKEYQFRTIHAVEITGPFMYCHKKYQFPFRVICSDRPYHVCALTM